MKKTFDDVLKDIEKYLIGKELNSISGSAAPFSVSEIDYKRENVVLSVQGRKKTWTFERLEKVWKELYYHPAANVEIVFGGSGSSRNQVETIYASMAYVEWLYVKKNKCIAYVGEDTHPYGTLKHMDEDKEITYQALMRGSNPRNPILDPDEIDVGEGKDSEPGRLMIDDYKEMDLTERRQAFTQWLEKSKKPDGAPYADTMIKGYSVVLETYPKRLTGITLENTNLYYYWEAETFPEVVQTVKSADNFIEINKKAFNSGLSAAMLKYSEFLIDMSNRTVDGDEEEGLEDSIMRSCLEIQREPRTVKIHPLNFIIYGAPGTGKTYSTAEYALAIIENRKVDISKKDAAERKKVMSKYNDYIRKGQIVFITFHQSYGYVNCKFKFHSRRRR